MVIDRAGAGPKIGPGGGELVVAKASLRPRRRPQ